ncbi:hypothetical protein C8R45DRAFT_1216822 [Mycena sanguinolenta]|nr:hypothetical protein C8R45DRAFT_1216822 [Mycena sanguinolenta]
MAILHMRNLTSDRFPSLLLALVAAIPNHALRYTALGFLLVVTILCTVHFSSLPTQIHQLAASIDETQEYIRREVVHYPRCYGGLTQQMRRLLEVAKTASSIKSHILNSETERFNWKRYLLRSKEIQECAKDVKKIDTAVQLVLEAEHQRRLADDIIETQFLLTAA